VFRLVRIANSPIRKQAINFQPGVIALLGLENTRCNQHERIVKADHAMKTARNIAYNGQLPR
jgi:hypothetical protein